MKENKWLMIVLAFIAGYMLKGMMKQMCGGRLVEGISFGDYMPRFAAPTSGKPEYGRGTQGYLVN